MPEGRSTEPRLTKEELEAYWLERLTREQTFEIGRHIDSVTNERSDRERAA